MANEFKPVALAVCILFFLLVTVLGFFAARWRRGSEDTLEEWSLGGRRFGTLITWFLLGGDFYTAYTVVAVPALVWGVGAAGFFALPYAILVYPVLYLLMPRLWSVAQRHGFVTPADFVRARYGSPILAAAIALTGILSMMPYIALQLVGMQVVFSSLGVGGPWPMILAFSVLAAYTYQSGLRAPALIAFVKDIMIFATVLMAIIVVPEHLGGYGAAFAAAAKALATKPVPGHLILPAAGFLSYSTLILGSALAAYMYPHTITGVLSASSAQVVRRNAALLPAYTFLLGLIAMLGIMALAAGIKPSIPSAVVPDLLLQTFPQGIAGFCLAAIAVSALVPAAIMAIAAGNLFTRNLWCEFLAPGASHAAQARVGRFAALGVKVGALAFTLAVPTQYAINLQLLGGVWILQTFPAVGIGLFTRRLHPAGLFAGWLIGMASGTAMVASTGFRSAIYPLHLGTITLAAYAAIYALLLNLFVAVIVSAIFGPNRHADLTTPADYEDADTAAA